MNVLRFGNLTHIRAAKNQLEYFKDPEKERYYLKREKNRHDLGLI